MSAELVTEDSPFDSLSELPVASYLSSKVAHYKRKKSKVPPRRAPQKGTKNTNVEEKPFVSFVPVVTN
jgi:hypothetical protein